MAAKNPPTIHKFVDSIKVGIEGEQRVASYLKSKGWLVFFESTNLYDLRVRKEDQEYFIEVKYDRASTKTGNIFWEIGPKSWTEKYNLIEKGEIYLVYVFPEGLYFSDISNIKNWDFTQYRTAVCYNQNYSMVGHLVPLAKFKSYFKYYEVE